MTSPIGDRNGVVRLVKVVSLSLVVSFAVYAQVTGGTLTGTVSDPSGAVILNAKIIIKDVATTVTRAVSTNAAGVYSAPNLLPGIYEVTVSAPGFATLNSAIRPHGGGWRSTVRAVPQSVRKVAVTVV